MAILNTFHTSEFSGDSRTSSASQAFGGLAKRMIRAGVLVAFLVMGGLFLYLKAFRNASLDGVVNAPKYLIRAPIEGVFRIANLGVGSRIVPGEAIATISNERVDDQLEAELSAKLLRLIREIAAQEVILREIDTFRERLLTRLDELRKTNIRKYDQLIMGSTERAAKLQLMTDSSFQDLQRFAMLAKAGVETPVRVDGYRRVFIQNESDSKTAARVASLTVIDKEAAEKGYFLGENVWDVPYTQQRLDEIVILSQQLALRSQVLEAEREEVTERLASERTRTALLRRLTIYSQSTAVVSALLAGDGFEVLKGEALMEVLDLSRTYLEATLPESRYERLRQGAQVRAKLVNSGTFLRGTIVCVLGPGAAMLIRFKNEIPSFCGLVNSHGNLPEGDEKRRVCNSGI